MTPKKKSKGGKGTKGSSGIIDGVSISEMSREQLESFVSHIKLELEREREERNFFQLERDKIRTFWEITRQQLEENRASLKNKDKELEDSEGRHRQEIKVYQQKIKHLMYEQQTQLSQMELKNMVMLKNAEGNFQEQELCLLNDIKELKAQKQEEEDSHLYQIRLQIKDNNEKTMKIRTTYEDNCRALEHKYQRFLEQFRAELEFKNEIEVNEIEERKNKYVKMLMQSHDKIYNDIMRFYTEITAKNLALISLLKDKLVKVKDEKYRMMHELHNIKKQNAELIVPLKIAQQTVEKLQHQVKLYKRDCRKVQISQKQQIIMKKKCEDLQYLCDTLKFSSEQLKKDKDELQVKLVNEFLEFQQKTVYQNIVLEQKISELQGIVESKEAQIIDILIGDSDNNFNAASSTNMQDILNEKNEKISALTKELSALMKTHNHIIQNYKSTLKTDTTST